MDRYNKRTGGPSRKNEPSYGGRNVRDERFEEQKKSGIIDEIIKGLENPQASVDLVSKIVNSPKEFNIKSESSYRKIHDLFSDVLDSTLNMINSNTLKAQINQVYLNLSKVKVIIEYQKARGQIGDNMAKVLNHAIDMLKKQLDNLNKNNQPDLQGFRKLIENIRVIIDSFAVLAALTKKKGKESE